MSTINNPNANINIPMQTTMCIWNGTEMKIHTETEMENHNGTTWNRTEMVWKLNDTERNETLRPGQERFMHLEVQTRV